MISGTLRLVSLCGGLLLFIGETVSVAWLGLVALICEANCLIIS